MSNKAFVLETMKKQGRASALAVQENSVSMSGTELNAQRDYIPFFQAAKARQNMLERKTGFVCKSSAGRVVRLIQNYDSDIYPHDPEDLPAQWRFVWSHDPSKALPFISLSTSPYDTGDCCTENDIVYRSTMDGNVWGPSTHPGGWEQVNL